MQIVPGGTPVGGEITAPQPPPQKASGAIPPVETAIPTPEESAVPVEVQATPLPTPDPTAEVAALGDARQDVEVGAAEGAAPPPAEVVGEPAAAGSADTAANRQAVNELLSGTNPAAAAAGLESGVADNHLATPPAAEGGDIAQVAAGDEAEAELGPEPVPAPPEAAVPVTAETPDNLTAVEASAPPPPPPPPPPAPPTIDALGQVARETADAAEQVEPGLRPENNPALRGVLSSLDGDVGKLYKLLGLSRGFDGNETKTGEGQQ